MNKKRKSHQIEITPFYKIIRYIYGEERMMK